ncbi:MAG: hypothetical protein DRI71_12030 [Bacteroidetes bacterium]|nr:MAG: hypothetical protein DRI71_12030 [Bacteroidota bacterium]
MAENLRTVNYNEPSPISLVTDGITWSNMTFEDYSWYDNDEATYKPEYGALYNWYAVNTGNLCPTGWHVPTDSQWKILEIYLGMTIGDADKLGWRGSPVNVGGKLKEAGTNHWADPNTLATNETNFNGLPAGIRDYAFGVFQDINTATYWWSSTAIEPDSAWYRSLGFNSEEVGRNGLGKTNGLSVRCLKSSIETDFLTFSHPELVSGSLVIDNVNHTITAEVNYGADLSTLAPTIGISTGATISPLSDVAQDFTSLVTYTVTAEDGSATQNWTVTVTVNDGLVAYYPFSGDATDASGNSNNGTLGDLTDPATSPALTTDRFGNTNSAYGFDGVDDYIIISDNDDMHFKNQDFTTAIWFYYQGQDGELFGTGNMGGCAEFRNFIENEKFKVTLASESSCLYDDYPTSDSLTYNSWYFSTVRREGNKFSYYLNGDLIADFILDTSALVDHNDGFRIGYSGDGYYKGIIDDISIYNRALSVTEIQALYQKNGWDINNINEFSLAEQTGAAEIDTTAHTINIEVPYGTDLSALVPVFTLSAGASATISTVAQISGNTANDYSLAVTYTITAPDGSTTQDWLITVSFAPNNATDILTFSLSEQINPAIIDAVNHTVDIEVAYGTVVNSLTATFTLSPGAIADIGIVTQESGITVNDFSSTVHYEIIAEDGITPQGWDVMVAIEKDNEAPIFSNLDLSTLYESATVNLNLVAWVTDNFDLASVSFNYRHSNASEFSNNVISSLDAGYTVSITESDITDVGMEYFFYAEDASGNTTSTDTVQIVIQYNAENGPVIPDLGEGGEAKDWRMFSIPFVLDNKNVSTLFEASLGTYDPSKWRIFHYKNDTERFVEYKNGLSVVERGKGYWFNSVQRVTIPMSPGKAPGNTKDNLATLSLAAGWNQVGNPYTFDVSWADVISYNGITNEVESNLRVFANGTSLTNSVVLKAFGGAYLKANQAITLEVPLIANSGGRIQDTHGFNEGWLLNMNLEVGVFSNMVSGLGMHPDAKFSNDRYDQIRVPRFEKYIDASFEHNEYFMPNFSRDIVPDQENYVWELTVSTNVDDYNRIISWDKPEIDENKKLTLLDKANGNVVDMLITTKYSYAEDNDRKFKVIYGDRDYLLEQLGENKIQLGNNYPNPFTNATTIPFSVYGVGDEFKVLVKIYSVNGSLIKTLLNTMMPSGIYSIKWDGKDNAGKPQLGLFIYSLEVETSGVIKTFRKKMIRQ